MSLLVIIGILVGIVLGALLYLSRRAQPVLLPVLLVIGVAGLSFAVTWEKEQERRARETADAALYERATAAITRQEAAPAMQAPLPPTQPPVMLPPPSPLQRPATGAAAPAAVRRPGGAS